MVYSSRWYRNTLLTISKPNILIDGSGYARVCDFGLASIAHGKYTTGIKSEKGHTARWSAPEILFGECTTSKQADIFAFGMVVIEVRAPFNGHHDVMNRVMTLVWCWFPT